jgi:hypothetical protein
MNNFFSIFSMVKTILALDLKAQHISQLNEHILVVDRIRKAGRNAFMSKLVKHSWVLKQPGEITMVNNSSPVDERMKGDTLASNSQGNNLLQNKLLNLNGNDGATILSPSLNLRGLVLGTRLLVC